MSDANKFNGGIFDNITHIIGSVLPVAGQVYQQHAASGGGSPSGGGGGCGVGRMVSDRDISSCLDQLIAQSQSVAATGDHQAMLQANLAILDALNSDQYFAQSSSNAYLANQKRQFTQYVADIRAAIARQGGSSPVSPTQTQTVISTNAQGQTVTTQVPVSSLSDGNFVSGVPNVYLLGAGAAIVGLLLLKK